MRLKCAQDLECCKNKSSLLNHAELNAKGTKLIKCKAHISISTYQYINIAFSVLV